MFIKKIDEEEESGRSRWLKEKPRLEFDMQMSSTALRYMPVARTEPLLFPYHLSKHRLLLRLVLPQNGTMLFSIDQPACNKCREKKRQWEKRGGRLKTSSTCGFCAVPSKASIRPSLGPSWRPGHPFQRRSSYLLSISIPVSSICMAVPILFSSTAASVIRLILL